jgi:hypothetical protein
MRMSSSRTSTGPRSGSGSRSSLMENRMICKHCGQEHDELAMLACFESQVKCWRDERDRLTETLNQARTQLGTGCPLCTYSNGKVTKSCSLHTELERVNLQNKELKSEYRLQVELTKKILDAKDAWIARAQAAELDVEELRKHLRYVCNIAKRLGPAAHNTHREEALHMLDGTLKDAEEVWTKTGKRDSEGSDRQHLLERCYLEVYGSTSSELEHKRSDCLKAAQAIAKRIAQLDEGK